MSRKGKSLAQTNAPVDGVTEADGRITVLVDSLLDKGNPFARHIMLEGLKRPTSLLANAKKTGLPFNSRDIVWRKKVEFALKRRDRKKLIELFIEENSRNPLPPGSERTLKALVEPRTWRKALLEAADQLKGKPGHPTRIKESEYPKIADQADKLYPIVLKLLTELHSGTTRTVEQLLRFWKQDSPEVCAFLERHVDELNALLHAEKLPKPAKKLTTKSRIIAEALVGRDYGLSFATSIERARQGRRIRSKNFIPPFPPINH